MKKHIPAFLAGALSTAAAASLAVGALAASGHISYDAANVSIFGEYTIEAGDTFEGESGGEIPSTITYIDEEGNGTIYIALRNMAQLLDAPLYWDENTQTVVFGEGLGPAAGVDITFDVSGSQTEQFPAEPELDLKAGPFTEVAPVDRSEISGGFHFQPQEETEYKSICGLNNQLFYIFEPYGNYVEITLTNHGAPVRFSVCRPYYNTNGVLSERFTTVSLGTGETMTRAFVMEPGTTFPMCYLRLDVDPLDMTARDTVDITYQVTQYQLENN